MARGRGSSAPTNDGANDPLTPLLEPVAPVSLRPLDPNLSDPVYPLVDDGRWWSPEEEAAPLLTSGVPTPIVEVYRKANSARRMTRRALFLSAPKLGFADALNVATCIRRKARREVLHALKKTRSGRGRNRRRTWRSNIRC